MRGFFPSQMSSLAQSRHLCKRRTLATNTNSCRESLEDSTCRCVYKGSAKRIVGTESLQVLIWIGGFIFSSSTERMNSCSALWAGRRFRLPSGRAHICARHARRKDKRSSFFSLSLSLFLFLFIFFLFTSFLATLVTALRKWRVPCARARDEQTSPARHLRYAQTRLIRKLRGNRSARQFLFPFSSLTQVESVGCEDWLVWETERKITWESVGLMDTALSTVSQLELQQQVESSSSYDSGCDLGAQCSSPTTRQQHCCPEQRGVAFSCGTMATLGPDHSSAKRNVRVPVNRSGLCSPAGERRSYVEARMSVQSVSPRSSASMDDRLSRAQSYPEKLGTSSCGEVCPLFIFTTYAWWKQYTQTYTTMS